MKIVFISRFGDSYGLATKMAEQGHDVFFWIEDGKYQANGSELSIFIARLITS